MYTRLVFLAISLSIASLYDITFSTIQAAQPQGSVIRIKTGAELNTYIGKGDYVVVYFSSLTCGPCKAFHDTFEELAQQFPDVVFIEVTYGVVPDAANLINKYVVRSFPTFIFFDKEGNKTNSFSGGSERTKEKIETEIAKLKAGMSRQSTVVSEVQPQGGARPAQQPAVSSAQKPEIKYRKAPACKVVPQDPKPAVQKPVQSPQAKKDNALQQRRNGRRLRQERR
jgi:thiol-disulfide isomerase/thioredoxin